VLVDGDNNAAIECGGLGGLRSCPPTGHLEAAKPRSPQGTSVPTVGSSHDGFRVGPVGRSEGFHILASGFRCGAIRACRTPLYSLQGLAPAGGSWCIARHG
jgi:hypothetical protein